MSGPLRTIARGMKKRVFGKMKKRAKFIAKQLLVKHPEGPKVEPKVSENAD